ncbi:carbohydrate ABC transporter permease [uncultured Tessaracoccus sp.]|uniref:carbohydrate ABC transporter permease n=1 Tax=uncultured Tessaracoccus sp. TaxID=905023 RepID=UPI0025CBA45A|nr:sugar ABC transporter permease [uncultured Tessaracoccus sp.]
MTVSNVARVEGAQSSTRGRRNGRGADRWRKRAEIALLTGPAVVIFLAFVIFPVIMAAYYGFFRWKGFGPPTDFVGLQNYVTILTDPQFLAALKHNAFIVVLSLVIQGPIAIAFALLLNQQMKGRSLIRVLIFVPYVIAEVIVGTGWSLMLQTSGAVNDLLAKMGLESLQADWIADPTFALWTLMVIISWKYIGFAVILMLAGMQGIPDELYEAAAVDGASYWQIQKSITLPLLGPTIRIWAFLSIIGSLQLFDLVYIIWGQYVADTAGTSTMATYMVREGRLSGNYGYGNAVAVVLFLISLVIALTYQRFVLRRDTEGALTGDRSKESR